MASANILVNDIAEKVKKLIARHNNLIAENSELKEKQKKPFRICRESKQFN